MINCGNAMPFWMDTRRNACSLTALTNLMKRVLWSAIWLMNIERVSRLTMLSEVSDDPYRIVNLSLLLYINVE